MRNPSKTLGLVQKPFTATMLHKSEEISEKEFKRWFFNVLSDSQYFKNFYNPNLKFNILCSGPRGTAGLGTDSINTCGSDSYEI